MKKILGIDPGASGAFSLKNSPEETPVTLKTPVVAKELDYQAIIAWLEENNINKDTTVACIEKVHAMPDQSAQSGFNFGRYFEGVIGLLMGMKIGVRKVTPQAWKKVILAGTKKEKSDAVNHCKQVYPEINLLPTPKSRKAHDGMAEATCIAEWCLRETTDWEGEPTPKNIPVAPDVPPTPAPEAPKAPIRIGIRIK